MNSRFRSDQDDEGVKLKPQDVIKRHSRSFSIASCFLPRQVRRDVQWLYAWCRAVDDTVDRCDDPKQAAAQLEMLRTDIHRIVKGQPVLHSTSNLIARLIQEERVHPKHARELIEGMQMDLDGCVIHSQADLKRYAYHAAGTVGLMMLSIMGVNKGAAESHAVSLGIAMQLTNIARDIAEDASRGRSYLPGLNFSQTGDSPNARESIRKVLALAESHYDHAAYGIDYLPKRCQLAIRVALAVYRQIGREILQRGADVWSGRISLSNVQLAKTTVNAFFTRTPENSYVPFSRSLLSSNESILPITYAQIFDMSKLTEPQSTLRQAKSAVYLGLSLTSFMAAALFVLVYVNPKDSTYGWLPLAYAAVSVMFGIITNLLSHRYESEGRTPANVNEEPT